MLLTCIALSLPNALPKIPCSKSKLPNASKAYTLEAEPISSPSSTSANPVRFVGTQVSGAQGNGRDTARRVSWPEGFGGGMGGCKCGKKKKNHPIENKNFI